MRTSSKIMFILFIVFLVGAILTSNFFLISVGVSENFLKNFNFQTYLNIFFVSSSLFFLTILYIRFLKSQRLHNALFFVTVPFTILFTFTVYLFYNINNLSQPEIQFVKTALKIESENYNGYIWLGLTTIVYIIILFFLFTILCRPLRRVEKATVRLGDGKVKDRITIGGGKQFKHIEFALNKINENFKQKDNFIHQTSSQYEKFVPKHFLKFFGKSNILELELGNKIQKEVTTLICKISNSKASTNLEENFNLINSYLNLISPIIRKYGGFIERFLGDGISSIFPNSEDALECSKKIVLTIEEKNFEHQNHFDKIEINVAINTCEAIFCVAGEKEQKNLTIIFENDEINSKMEKVNSIFGSKIIFSKRTLNTLSSNYPINYRYIGSFNIEKNNNEIRIFENLDAYSKYKREKLYFCKTDFEKAVNAYEIGDYQKAKEIFANVFKIVKEDRVAYVYYNLCNKKLS